MNSWMKRKRFVERGIEKRSASTRKKKCGCLRGGHRRRLMIKKTAEPAQKQAGAGVLFTSVLHVSFLFFSFSLCLYFLTNGPGALIICCVRFLLIICGLFCAAKWKNFSFSLPVCVVIRFMIYSRCIHILTSHELTVDLFGDLYIICLIHE